MDHRSSAVISPPRPTIGTGRATLKSAALYACFGVLILAIGIYTGLGTHDPMTAATLIGLLLLTPIIWNRPSLGTYILMGGVAVFEQTPLGFPDSITDQTLFFQNISSTHDLEFLPFSAAELIMGLTLGTVTLRRMAVGRRPLEFGPLFWAVAIYVVVVGSGFVYGLGAGGSWYVALREARSQVYIFVVYLLVINTIHDRRQVNLMVWIFLVGIAIKGLVGTWRYAVTLGGDLNAVEAVSRNANSILSHEEAYLFALFFLLGLILFLFRAHRGQLWFVIFTAAPVLVAFMASQRRAGSLVLLIGILVVIFVAYTVMKSRRKQILLAGILLLIAVPAYLGVTWNSTSIAAEPARAVKSLVSPNTRDAGSNDYRTIEALNLKYNIQDRPLLGSGFGHTINFYLPLPWIGGSFAFWDVIPHNTVLWVWMRLGIVGFIAFWFLVGRSIVAAIIATKETSDPLLQSLCVFTVVSLVTWVFIGMVDMGIVGARETVLIGLLIGLVSRIPQIGANARGKRHPVSGPGSVR